MRRPSRWGSALVAAAAVTALTGCGTESSVSSEPALGSVSLEPFGGGQSAGAPDVTVEPPDDGVSSEDYAAAATGAPVVFRACPRTRANPATTHLRPASHLTPAVIAQIPGGLPTGAVSLEHVADLTLADGTISAGNGYEAATGPSRETVEVSPRALAAPVTVAVYDSAQTGRRVLFVEVRIGPGTPVTWTEERALGIVTDGGDGGFVDGSAESPGGAPMDGGPGDYVEAFFPDGNSGSGNVCVQRVDVAGKVDAVLFATGFGDGGYPTFLGRDAQGDVVSVVHDSLVVPWSFSGLPGKAPAGADIS